MKLKTKRRTLLSLALAVAAAVICFAAFSIGAERGNTHTPLAAVTPRAEIITAEISSPSLLSMPDSALAPSASAPDAASETSPVTEALKAPESTDATSPDSAQTTDATAPESAPKSGNIFEEIYNFATAYLGDIFSLLAFLIGLATALLYKRGLVPGISKLGASIKASVDTAKEAGDKLAATTAEAHSIEDKKLDALSEKLGALCSELELMKTQLDLTGALEERAKIQGVLLMEVDLLYAVFTASSLPHYMKEELFKRVKEMKDALLKNEQAA